MLYRVGRKTTSQSVNILLHCTAVCRAKKRSAERRWMEKAAHDMDIALDEDQLYPPRVLLLLTVGAVKRPILHHRTRFRKDFAIFVIFKMAATGS